MSLLLLAVGGYILSSRGLAQDVYYVRAGATGANNGSDWNNAYATLPATLRRGVTYYVADGSYGSYTFNTPLSGSTPVTIRKATLADHGTDTGWQTAYGDGQAVFGELTVNKGYLVVNGQTRNETTWKDGYGFRFSAISANSINGDSANNSSFSYCDIGAAYSETPAAGYGQIFYMVYNQQNITLSRSWLHNYTGTACQFAGARYMTVEYCFFGPGWGKEAIRGGNYNDSDYFTIRYNRFWNAIKYYPYDSTSGMTAEIAIWDVGNTYTGHEIYGNWFYNQNVGAKNGTILLAFVGGTAENCKIYNNTFAGIADTTVYGHIYAVGTGNEAKNNLFYNCADAKISVQSSANNVVSANNPFVNYGGLDFHIISNTGGTYPRNAGTALAAQYNTDPDGKIRGADGAWDAGAFEYAESGPDTTPPSINGAAAGSITTNSAVISFSTSESARSGVEYGLTTGYGNSATNSSLLVTHSLPLSGLMPNTTYHYRVHATDAAGNHAQTADLTFQTVAADGVSPTVSLTAPVAGSVVSNSVTLTATASDNVGVAGVLFLVDGAAVGSEDTIAPYSVVWDTTGVGNGSHSVAARARDAAGNQTTSVAVTVTVANAAVGGEFRVGDRVMVNIAPTLRVRASAALAGSVLGEQPYGALGTVLAGPVSADGYTWWQINYDNAPDGWSIQGESPAPWLILAPASAPLPPSGLRIASQ